MLRDGAMKVAVTGAHFAQQCVHRQLGAAGAHPMMDLGDEVTEVILDSDCWWAGGHDGVAYRQKLAIVPTIKNINSMAE
jgi:hypothetical protein